jgi:formylglycine-generating enzyme required for sulfatase activity
VGAHGEFATKAKPGVHALKVSLQGEKDFEQSVTLLAQQATRIEARLENLGPTAGLVRGNPPPGHALQNPPAAGPVRENPKDGLKYVWIPPGTFVMGCSPGDVQCKEEETPSHQVTIAKGFWLGQTEVTVGAYKRFTAAALRRMPKPDSYNKGWTNDKLPMFMVSWQDAQAYCAWAGGRLPTEAEWEYAARAGSTRPRYGRLDEVAWYDEGFSGDGQHEVGQKRANAWGLFDTLGNLWEMVSDPYDEKYYLSTPTIDPKGPDAAEYRVLRGGAFWCKPEDVRVSTRWTGDLSETRQDRGFRCARQADVP